MVRYKAKTKEEKKWIEEFKDANVRQYGGQGNRKMIEEMLEDLKNGKNNQEMGR